MMRQREGGGRTLRGTTPRLGALCALVLVVLCAGAGAASVAGAQTPPPLRWAADAEGGAPYIFKDPKNPSKHIGFEVELAAALAQIIGRPIVFGQYEYKSLFSGLNRGDFDLALNGLEVTPDRQKQVRFTRPYYFYTLQLVVRADERRFSDLDGVRRLGGTVGTLEDTAAQRLLAASQVKARLYEGQVEPYNELASGRLDAVLLDLPIAEYYARPNKRLRFQGAPFAPGPYAIALRRTDEALATALDAGLQRLFENGTLERIYRKWGIWNEDQRALGKDDRGSATTGAPTAKETLSATSAIGTTGIIPAKNATAANAITASSAATDSPAGLAALATEWTFSRYFPLLLEGAGLTVLISLLSMLLAIALGLGIAAVRLYAPPWLSWTAVAYIELFRGLPVLLLLFFLYYALPEIALQLELPVSLRLSPLQAAVLGFGLNYAAYEAEIYRAGLLSVPHGQWEAAVALGLRRRTTFRRIILPQAIRFILPPMTSDFVALFKDTSVVSIIAVVELSKQYQILAKSSGMYLELALCTAGLYLVMSVPLGLLSRRLEARFTRPA